MLEISFMVNHDDNHDCCTTAGCDYQTLKWSHHGHRDDGRVIEGSSKHMVMLGLGLRWAGGSLTR